LGFGRSAISRFGLGPFLLGRFPQLEVCPASPERFYGQTQQQIFVCHGRGLGIDGYSFALLSRFQHAHPLKCHPGSDADGVGQPLRLQSWEGGEDYRALAMKAMEWFDKSVALNRYYSYGFLHHAMCLDWLDRHDEASSLFEKARAIDPNGYYVHALLGWHYVQ